MGTLATAATAMRKLMLDGHRKALGADSVRSEMPSGSHSIHEIVSEERTAKAVRTPTHTNPFGITALSGPHTPMRRPHRDLLSGIRVDPSAEDPAARKDHPVN